MAKAREQRPELEAMRRQLKGSQAAVTSAKREFFPKIKALASTGQSAISDRNGKWWYGVFGSLSIPLFTGGRIENEIREAQAIQGEMEARMRELAQEVELQVAVAYHTHEALKEKGAVTRDQIAIARTALDLSRERLRLGLGSIIEVTQAEVAVTRAETAHALARFGVLTATAALDYATGSGLPRYEETQ